MLAMRGQKEDQDPNTPGLADEIVGQKQTVRAQRKWGHKLEKECSKYHLGICYSVATGTGVNYPSPFKGWPSH